MNIRLPSADAIDVPMGRNPSAMVPVLMSLLALSLELLQLGVKVLEPEWQLRVFADASVLLLLAQLPIMVWFAWHWLPRTPARAWTVLCVQLLAAATALVPLGFPGG